MPGSTAPSIATYSQCSTRSSRGPWNKTEGHLRSKYLFGTTSADEFRKKTLSPDAVAENMGDVLQMGQKDTKYMKFVPPKNDHAWGRGNTKYTQEFPAKSLENFQANRALAESFASAPDNLSGDNSSVQIPMGSTTNQDEFVPYPSASRQGIIPPTNTVPPYSQVCDGLSRTMSHEQEQYPKRPHVANLRPLNATMLKNLRVRPDGQLETYPLNIKSSYEEDYAYPDFGGADASTVASLRSSNWTASSLRTASASATSKGSRHMRRAASTSSIRTAGSMQSGGSIHSAAWQKAVRQAKGLE